MKPQTGKLLEECRIKSGQFASTKDDGFNGAFFIPTHLEGGSHFGVICSDGEGWEHVSVSLPDRTPTWDEMCYIKSLFWESHEVVMQLHPAEAEYVKNCSTCVHLWKPTSAVIPTPPAWMVGVKGLGVLK